MKKLTSVLLSSSLLLTAMPAFASGFTIEGELLANSNRARHRRARLMQIYSTPAETEAETPQEEPAEEEAPTEEAPAVEETAPAVEEAPAEKVVAPKKVETSNLQRLQNRACPRAKRRAMGDAKMMERINERLLNRFGFQCM